MHDLAISVTGDLVPNWAGGLQEADGVILDYQDINWRMLTNDPGQPLWPLGANLEDLIGRSNTQDTGILGEQKIQRALTFDGRFSSREISVQSVPIAVDQIQFFISVLKPGLGVTTQPYISTVVSLGT